MNGVRADLLPFEAVVEDPRALGDYDVLLVSAMTSDEASAARLARLWRRWSGGPAILGGPVTADPSSVDRLGYDLGVYGEAEETLPRLLSMGLSRARLPGADELRRVPGLVVPGYGLTGRPRPVPRQALGYLHSVDIEGYPLYWASRVYVEIVRGCSNFRRPRLRLPGRRSCIECGLCWSGPLSKRVSCPVGIPAGCGYCSVPELYGPARSRPLDVVVREVRELVRRGVTRIVLSAPDALDYGRDLLVDPEPLTDPCRPPANLDALRELLETLYTEVPELAAREAYLMIENVKACLVDERVAKLLGRYLKGTPVHIGAESGDDRLLAEIGRPAYTSDVARAVRLLSSEGLQPYVYFIYALPGETRESAERTVEFMEDLWRAGAYKITAYRFRPLPATAFEGLATEVTEYSEMVKRKASELNVRSKVALIDATVRAVVAGYHRGKGMLVAYPLPHGPVALLKGPRSLVGWLVELKIVDVVSDRMVEAVLVRKVKRLAPPSSSGRRSPGASR
jgi:radical SAM superfamily enzyme YgiQ (UPF0313 family)